MRKLLVAMAAMLLACSSDQGVAWKQGSFTQVVDAAREQNKPILVDFYSDT